MKHINTFKLFEARIKIGGIPRQNKSEIRRYQSRDREKEEVDEITLYLKDIFQELEDLGMCADIEVGYYIFVKIRYGHTNGIKKFKYKDIADYMGSTTDYLKSIGWVTKEVYVRYINDDGAIISEVVDGGVVVQYLSDKYNDIYSIEFEFEEV